MRQIAALLSMLIALSASAAELWRWKDADGVVHYSDRPVPGAERIQVLTTQKSTGEVTPQNTQNSTPAPAQPEIIYRQCIVSAPANDQVFNGVNAVEAAILVDPPLQPDHRVQVLLNGQVETRWPPGMLTRTLVNLNRGSYTLSVRVLDASGRPVCTGPTSNFHVRQPSLLAPARQAPARKP